jgi:1,4-alpha-glucan branching enzyme
MDDQIKKPSDFSKPQTKTLDSPGKASRFSEEDIYLLNEGNHFRLYKKLGAHPDTVNGVKGVSFSVWAPNAEYVSVIGDFNNWNRARHGLSARQESGIWEGFVPGVKQGAVYKFFIRSQYNNFENEKTDPFGFYNEVSPKSGSVVWDLQYEWDDRDWMKSRHKSNDFHISPISVYEVHLGSWMRVSEDGNRFLTYREIAPKLAKYVKEMGFTHVELMPIMEHPYYGSWGYQITCYFAPTSRYGNPQDLMFLIDVLHQEGIGVFLDWVPSHFAVDGHGLSFFDGTHLYEHQDDKKGWHPDWGSMIFNYGRREAISFLISNALFWLDTYHIDGLRVDAVASMLYLDYSRKPGGWIPNEFGGRENLEAISFLRLLNEEVYRTYPDVQTIAEESTDWPMVSKPNYVGGLGFGMKWDMGWMNDTLEFMKQDSIFRKYHHDQLTFHLLYSYHENFILPLSHDEVVHGKGSLVNKMPGDEWQKFANLRLLYGHMFSQPGKKLLFMGSEFGQLAEWDHESSLDWHLLDLELHKGIQLWVRDLNKAYRAYPEFYEGDIDPKGFEWIDCGDYQNSVLTLLRKGKHSGNVLAVALNFTPVPRYDYQIGIPLNGYWKEVLNSDAKEYGGSGVGNLGGAAALDEPFHGRPFSLKITLPPLAAVFFSPDYV